jgi:hypothetical protein
MLTAGISGDDHGPTRPGPRHSTFVVVLDGSEEPKRYRPRSCRSRETHGDVFRTGIVGECGYSWHSREPADIVRDYAPEFEAPSETVPVILLQGTEHFEPHIDMRRPNPPLQPVAGEPDKSSLASN